MGVTDDIDRRLASYFAGRAIDLLEQAKRERDPANKLRIEQIVIEYWRAAAQTRARQ